MPARGGDLEHAPGADAADPGWTNRLFMASAAAWRGYFPLSGDVLWNPRDETGPYALIFDPRQWTPIVAVSAPPFRGWRYLESPPSGEPASSSLPRDDRDQQQEASSPRSPGRRCAIKRWRYFPHRPLLLLLHRP